MPRKPRRHHSGKGPLFERWVCRKLSLWVTSGKRHDVFWRSAMSGGRATILGTDVRQAGDIVAVAEEGRKLNSSFIVECKHRRDVGIDRFCVRHKGPLVQYWRKLLNQCIAYNKQPMMIVRQNRWPTLLLMLDSEVPERWPVYCRIPLRDGDVAIMLFEEIIKRPFKSLS